ncbi:hypothetical protein OAW56_00665 [Gammaproteobacteria bacterium]|jgi:hypothetical protein|nr:hypothetical protein [Gammaproteobacteria bacterium]
MEAIILILIGAVSGASIVTLMNISKKGREGAKGITEEYTTKSGIKRTAKKDREDHIV